MNKTRPERVYFRVTKKELEQINQCVKASGMTKQDWLLSVVTPHLTGGDTQQNEVVTPVEAKNICPVCGATLEVKNGRRGKFWGCSNFPNCRYTEDWKDE